ncbi:hypothetical protein BGX28_001463, partial [Mortierella sp. GBA30]
MSFFKRSNKVKNASATSSVHSASSLSVSNLKGTKANTMATTVLSPDEALHMMRHKLVSGFSA